MFYTFTEISRRALLLQVMPRFMASTMRHNLRIDHYYLLQLYVHMEGEVNVHTVNELANLEVVQCHDDSLTSLEMKRIEKRIKEDWVLTDNERMKLNEKFESEKEKRGPAGVRTGGRRTGRTWGRA